MVVMDNRVLFQGNVIARQPDVIMMLSSTDEQPLPSHPHFPPCIPLSSAVYSTAKACAMTNVAQL